MFKRFTPALSALLLASPVAAQNVDPGHLALGRAVASTGVEFKINPVECFGQSAYGWYWARKNELVVCQENARKIGVEIRWTAEDFDTLRHEAQHLIQDCMDGLRQGALGSVYQQPVQLAKSVLGTAALDRIAETYAERGEHVVVMEFEAFAVAAMNDPLEQASDIASFCF